MQKIHFCTHRECHDHALGLNTLHTRCSISRNTRVRNCALGHCAPKKKDVQQNTRHYQYCSADNIRASLFLFHCNEYYGAIHHTAHICCVSNSMHYTRRSKPHKRQNTGQGIFRKQFISNIMHAVWGIPQITLSVHTQQYIAPLRTCATSGITNLAVPVRMFQPSLSDKYSHEAQQERVIEAAVYKCLFPRLCAYNTGRHGDEFEIHVDNSIAFDSKSTE